MNVFTELRTYELKVRWLLERYPKTRDSDKQLILYYLIASGQDIKKEKTSGRFIWRFDPAHLEEIPNFETIRRSRARIQNLYGDWLPTDKRIAKRRRIREEYMRAYYSIPPHAIP